MSVKNLPAALAAIVRKPQRGLLRVNEFDRDSILDCGINERVLPQLSAWDDSITSVLELKIGASFTVFRSDLASEHSHSERNALQAISSHLYGDVLADLAQIARLIGDGKRRAALNAVSELMNTLSGNDR